MKFKVGDLLKSNAVSNLFYKVNAIEDFCYLIETAEGPYLNGKPYIYKIDNKSIEKMFTVEDYSFNKDLESILKEIL